MGNENRTLDQYRDEYSKRRFLATPLTGALVWLIVAIASLFLKPVYTTWVLFVGTGSIGYLAILISKFTGEDFLDKEKSKNPFNALFFHSMFASLVVYSIAIPFFLVDYTSLPLTVGILTGTMWIPFSWIIKHPIGIFHGVGRAVAVLAAWYMFPDQRFLVIPLVIVAFYIITIAVLEMRWRSVNA